MRLKGIGVGNEGASDGGCSCASALVVSRERLGRISRNVLSDLFQAGPRAGLLVKEEYG